MKSRFTRKLLASVLSLLMICNMGLTPVLADAAEGNAAIGTSLVCTHHEHDDTCGYAEGRHCTHEHTDECYKEVTDCAHKHTGECYPATASGEATPPDAAEPTECTHTVCDEASGCATKTIDCAHDSGEHDDTCGYAEGSLCTFDPKNCEKCNPKDSSAENAPGITASIEITTQPADQEVDYAYTAAPVLTVEAKEPEGVTYQWHTSDGSPIADAESASYTVPLDLAVGAHLYYCTLTKDGSAVNTRTATVTVAQANTEFSSILNGAEVTVGTTGADYKTLAEAVKAVPSGGTIRLVTDISEMSFLYIIDIYVFTIELDGHTISAPVNAKPAPNAAGATLEFRTNHGSALTINGPGMVEASSKSYGAIYVEGGNLTLNDVTVCSQATAITANWDSVITGSTVTASGAGATAISHRSAAITIQDSLISASGDGGQALALANGSVLTLSGSTLYAAAGASASLALPVTINPVENSAILGATTGQQAAGLAGNRVYGAATLPAGAYTIPDGSALGVPGGATFTISNGATLTSGGEDAVLQVEGGMIITSGATVDFTTGILMGKDKITVEEGGRLIEPSVKYVAQIGADQYASLQAAIDAVAEGGTITLLDDLLDSVTIPNTKTAAFTLDLSGHKLSPVATDAITNLGKGVLTIQDSVGGGEIRATVGSAVVNGAEAALILKSGTLSATTGVALNNKDRNNVTIEGGTVQATEGAGTAIVNAWNCTVLINGGVVDSCNGGEFSNGTIRNVGQSKLTIAGGVVSSTVENAREAVRYVTISNQNGSTVEVTGGKVTATTPKGIAICNYQAFGNIIVSGGEVSATGTIDGRALYNNSDLGALITVSGGSLIAPVSAVEVFKGTAKITGGILSSPKNAVLCSGSAAKTEIFGGILSGGVKKTAGTVTMTGGVLLGDWAGTTGTVEADKSYRVYGTTTLDQDLSIPDGVTLTVPAATRLNNASGKTITVRGKLNIDGGIVDCTKGALVCSADDVTKSNDGKLYIPGTITGTATKVYDGTTAFTGVTVTPAYGTFTATATGTADSANVGANRSFTVTGVTASSDVYDLAPESVTGTVAITKKPLASDMIAEIPEQAYSGSVVEPELTVTDGNPSIIQTGDYSVSYKDHTTIGCATATITATKGGNYSGMASKTFTIMSDSALTLTADKASYTYGDTIHFTANLAIQTMAGRSVSQDTMDFYYGTVKLNDQPVPLTHIGGVGTAAWDYNTIDNKIPTGDALTVTAQYHGSTYMRETTTTVEIALTKAAGSVSITSYSGKVYDGTPVADPTQVIKNSTGAVTFEWYKGGTKLTSAPKDVGSYTVKAILVSDNNFESAESAAESFTITKSIPTLNINTMSDKPYDGQPIAAPAEGNMSITGALYADVSFAYSKNGDMSSPLNSAPKDAGTYYVQASVATTDNTNAAQSAAVSFTIAKAPLTITGGTVTDKKYDGNTTAPVTALTFNGLVSGEILEITTDYTVGAPTFNNADVGTGKTVTGTAALTTSAKANNYSLTGAYSTIGNIILADAPAAPTFSTMDDTANTYTFNSISGTIYEYSLNDGASWNDITASGNTTTISVGNIAVAVGDLQVYVKATATHHASTILSNTTAFTANIEGSVEIGGTPKYGETLTATAKDYQSGATLHYQWKTDTTNIGTDSATLAIPGEAVGKTITVEVTATSYNGKLSATTGVVAKKAVTAMVAAGITKDYDGKAAANVSLSIIKVNDSDAITITAPNATYDSANIGTSKSITLGTLTKTGTAADWYTVTAPSGVTGDITVKPVTVSISGGGKAYDGTNTATVTYTVNGKVSGEDVTASGTAIYASADAGTSKTITANGITLGGTDAENYSLAVTTATTTATITAKAVTPTIDIITTATYDGTAKEPTLAVKDGNTTLIADIDYTAEYSDNINAGTDTGNVAVTLTGNYSGTANASFTIMQASGLAVSTQPATNAKAGVARNYNYNMNNIALNKTDTGAKTYMATEGTDANNILSNVVVENNALRYDIADTAVIGNTVTVTITIKSINYTDVTATLTINVTVNTTALATAIDVANTAKSNIVKNDGAASSVASGTKFVTTAEMNALIAAINAAENVKSIATTDIEVTNAINALNAAVDTFKAAIKTGTYTAPGGNSGSFGGTTTPSTPNTDAPKTGSTTVIASVDKTGNATVTVTDKAVADAIKAAQEAAKKDNLVGKMITVEIVAQTDEVATQITAILPKTVQETLISNKVDAVKITTGTFTMSFSQNAILQIYVQAMADVTIIAAKSDTSKLTSDAKALIGSRPMFDFYVTYNNGSKKITDFGGNTVSIAIPYTLSNGEVPGNIYAIYVDGTGNAIKITNSSYDANKKAVIFAASHFSQYGVGYQANAGLSDIANHWAKTDIEFVANRGLMSGTSATEFSPNNGMTRGMFVTALGRLAGVDSTKYKNTNFTDVASTAYYAPYTAWALEKGITSGTSATTFSPDKTIARQELAVFMQNYAKAMGYTVPRTRAEVTFADASSIGAFAKDAVKAMQMAGIMNGKDGNKFDPTGTATRAEVAATLHRYVELVIDIHTAQGLDTNDSGSAMMYENGKAVKSASRTTNGLTYNFNTNGEMALPPADNK